MEYLHAKDANGPVNCQIRLMFHGETYPKKCARCGFGACPFFDHHGNPIDAQGNIIQPPASVEPTEFEKLKAEFDSIRTPYSQTDEGWRVMPSEESHRLYMANMMSLAVKLLFYIAEEKNADD